MVAARSAAATGLLLVILAVGLLGFLAMRESHSTDLTAAFGLAAGYLLGSGVSLIRKSFSNEA